MQNGFGIIFILWSYTIFCMTLHVWCLLHESVFSNKQTSSTLTYSKNRNFKNYLSIYLSIFFFFSLLNKNLSKNSYFYYEIRFVSKQMLCFPKAFIFWWTELAYFPGPTQELNFKTVNFYYFVKKFFIQKKKKFMSF